MDAMDIMKAVGKQLTELMEERGMTQRALAEKSGVSRSTIGRLVRCELNDVALDTIFYLCRAMDVSPIDFLDSLPPLE